MRQPIAVAYGMGVDSTSMLVGMKARGTTPDMILFADTGDEKPETYAYFEVMQAWLEKVPADPRRPVHAGPSHVQPPRGELPPERNAPVPCLRQEVLLPQV
jgi:hypothetical protein